MSQASAPPRQRTAIRGGWVVAFDGSRHRIISDGAVVFVGDRIVAVGVGAEADADTVIDARGKLVIPGLISTHAHIGAHPGDRLVLDVGRRELQGSGFLHYEPRKALHAPPFGAGEDTGAALRFGLATLLRSGVTTVLDMGTGDAIVGRELVRFAGECGIRLYYGPGVTSAHYLWSVDGRVLRSWREDGGAGALRDAVDFIKEHHGRYDGRVHGMVIIHETFNAAPALLRAAKTAAGSLGVGLSIHCAEQVFEFHEILRTTGFTPVGYLASVDFLGPEVVLGHCLYADGHSRVGYPYAGDLETIARTGSSVAHSPVAVARRGAMLEDLQRYVDCGVTVSIGTDSYPHDMFAEMQYASMLGKVATRNHEAADAATVFTAATLGGAKALRRTDLGRLCPGAKADLVIVDFTNPRLGPVYDPVKALLHCATSDLVERVIVDGITVVDRGEVLAWDHSTLLAGVRASSRRVWDGFRAHHWAGRTAEEEFPPSFQAWTGDDDASCGG